MGDLNGKVAIVTGGNSGLGRETALDLAGRGASVVLACRNTAAAEEAAQMIRSQQPKADVSVAPLDLGSQDSVRKFAADFVKSGRPLHLLVANAGADFTSKRLTPEGVPLICQVNYLGHYTLTRLLEPVLIASAPSRIVSVSSIMHRLASIRNAARFLSHPKCASYRETKLAQVMFTFEAQRRLGRYGVDASAVDPGGVRTNVWKGRFAKPPLIWGINAVFAPASDGAKAIVHAATVDYNKEKGPRNGQRTNGDDADLRLYAKGNFSSPLLTWYGGPTKGPLGTATTGLWGMTAILLAILDWPLRNLSQGRLLSTTKRVPAMQQAYDQNIAKDLWERSARLANLPVEPQQPRVGKRSS